MPTRCDGKGGADSTGCTGWPAGIHDRLRFDTERDRRSRPAAEQAAAEGHGVCQDFAHIFIAVARAARHSGPLCLGPSVPPRRRRSTRRPAHAWAEAWVEDLGWVAFDPVNGICTDDAYLRVACGLDYRDAAPIAGARAGGGAETTGGRGAGRRGGAGQSQSQMQS